MKLAQPASVYAAYAHALHKNRALPHSGNRETSKKRRRRTAVWGTAPTHPRVEAYRPNASRHESAGPGPNQFIQPPVGALATGLHEESMNKKPYTKKQLHELLYQALETERGGIKIFEAALRCAQNEDLKSEWEKYLEA